MLFLVLMLSTNLIRSQEENETESDLVWIVDGTQVRNNDPELDKDETQLKSHFGKQSYGQMKPSLQSKSDEEEYEDDHSLAGEQCSGICVPTYECHDNDEEDGVGVIDARKKKYRKCPLGQVCCSHEVSNEDFQKCGISQPNNIKNRILSTSLNSESEFGEWPWMVCICEELSFSY